MRALNLHAETLAKFDRTRARSRNSQHAKSTTCPYPQLTRAHTSRRNEMRNDVVAFQENSALFARTSPENESTFPFPKVQSASESARSPSLSIEYRKSLRTNSRQSGSVKRGSNL